jgi:hypothetical protein
MRCLNCKYDLRNLAEHRCPECGREFDPNDATTFLTAATHLEFLTTVQRVLILFLLAVIVLIIIDFEPFRPEFLDLKDPGRLRYIVKLGVFGLVALLVVHLLLSRSRKMWNG